MHGTWNDKSATGQQPALDIKLHIANCSAADAKFLQILIQFFTDEANAALVERIRSGHFAIQYNPEDGSPHIVDLKAEQAAPNAKELINFFAIFSEDEWALLGPDREKLLRIYRNDRDAAWTLVNECLGYIPKARQTILVGEG